MHCWNCKYDKKTGITHFWCTLDWCDGESFQVETRVGDDAGLKSEIQQHEYNDKGEAMRFIGEFMDKTRERIEALITA